jgi:hypothetical protein
MARTRLGDDHKGHAQRRRARAAGVLAVNASGVDPQQNRYSMPGRVWPPRGAGTPALGLNATLLCRRSYGRAVATR